MEGFPKKRCFAVITALLFLSVALNVYYTCKAPEKVVDVKVETDTIVRTDTVRDSIPFPVYEKVVKVKHDTLKLAGDTAYVAVEVPITQKKYTNDSTYTAWVSGYKPNLDSIDVYRKTTLVERVVTLTVAEKEPWLVVGPSISAGYDFMNKTFAPTVGVAFTVNLFSLKAGNKKRKSN